MMRTKLLIPLTILTGLQMTAVSLTVGTFLMHQNQSGDLRTAEPCHVSEQIVVQTLPEEDCFEHCLEDNQRFHESDASLAFNPELPNTTHPGLIIEQTHSNINTPLRLVANIRPPPNFHLTIQKKE